MRLYICTKCGKKFVEERLFCPSCFSEDFSESSINGATVSDRVQLFATPAKFPESYYVLLVNNGELKIFCRSDTDIKEGMKVRLGMEDSHHRCR